MSGLRCFLRVSVQVTILAIRTLKELVLISCPHDLSIALNEKVHIIETVSGSI